MKTEISKFCEAYLTVLNALPPTMRDATAAMEKGDATGLLQHPLAILNDTRARLRSLVEKLESQQAYLLIFGPLKSGKSTLMNAISRSYVSEVTSLPGYPCLVYVRHSEQPHFSATRYNGRESVFANGQVLKDVIADSHIALAAQIREAEERRGSFDPRHDFSEAIRRVDVKLPVPTLAESSTVLVDTPGLYSRMNFGYDVLTREFRDSAACAVFVVKTDNLYLEQVFAEFNQLLGLFSRIFLVINVDSSKRDLQPDGTLLPSAESRNPQQIIEAFKTLSMAGPLRTAYEEKRLRIHAVDLMSAAANYLAENSQNGAQSGKIANGANATNGDHTAHGANGGTTPADDSQRQAFDTFLADLTEYLNSSDYTQEFMRDSLRQGTTLCGEMREVCAGPEIQELTEKHASLTTEMAALQEKIATTERLLGVDWEATFDQARTANAKAIDQAARQKAEALVKEMTGSLEEWYGTDASLAALTAQHWNPLLAQAAQALAADTRQRLHTLFGGTLGGAEPAAAVMTDLHAIDFPLAPIALACTRALDTAEPADAYAMAIKEEHVPVKKSFADWILFRGIATVRRRLFGEDLSQPIAPEIKAKRLPAEPTGAAFVEMATATVQEKFPELPARYAANLATAYAAQFRQAILERLRAQRDEFAAAHAERQAPCDTITAILGAMKALDEQSSKAVGEIILMAQQETGETLEVPGHPAALEGEPAPTGALQEYSAA
ncbi:MAG: dynamin family protein [Chthoniobacter sp.]|uniref:dynamin family protein n=1 Tax=Chthoniobacter sp. TaxID=2510640 RepID=UPI0032A244D6